MVKLYFIILMVGVWANYMSHTLHHATPAQLAMHEHLINGLSWLRIAAAIHSFADLLDTISCLNIDRMTTSCS